MQRKVFPALAGACLGLALAAGSAFAEGPARPAASPYGGSWRVQPRTVATPAVQRVQATQPATPQAMPAVPAGEMIAPPAGMEVPVPVAEPCPPGAPCAEEAKPKEEEKPQNYYRTHRLPNTACWAVPTKTPKYGLYKVAGGGVHFGHPLLAADGTWGYDYFGCVLRKRIVLLWNCRYQDGMGAYKTDGPKLIGE